MATKVLNRSFQEAKNLKEDEFYTQLPDIERELRHYKEHVTISRLGAAGATFSLREADFPILLFHLNHQVRRLDIQVFKADGSAVHPVFNYVTQQEYLGRNSTATTFFEFDWDGTRSTDNGVGNGDHRKVVPNGRYILKLSVLKALGDASKPARWESFTTSPITLARP